MLLHITLNKITYLLTYLLTFYFTQNYTIGNWINLIIMTLNGDHITHGAISKEIIINMAPLGQYIIYQ